MRKLNDDEKRKKVVGVRMTIDEYQKIVTDAEAMGQTVSGFIMDAIRRKKPVKQVFTKGEGREVIAHLGKIGGNINQLARAVNSGNVPSEVGATLLTIREDLDMLREYVTSGGVRGGCSDDSRGEISGGVSGLRQISEGSGDKTLSDGREREQDQA